MKIHLDRLTLQIWLTFGDSPPRGPDWAGLTGMQIWHPCCRRRSCRTCCCLWWARSPVSLRCPDSSHPATVISTSKPENTRCKETLEDHSYKRLKLYKELVPFWGISLWSPPANFFFPESIQSIQLINCRLIQGLSPDPPYLGVAK